MALTGTANIGFNCLDKPPTAARIFIRPHPSARRAPTGLSPLFQPPTAARIFIRPHPSARRAPTGPLVDYASPAEFVLATAAASSMAELAQAEFYSASGPAAPVNTTGKSVQVWRALVSWVALLFRLLLQILRGTPSWAQFLSFIGLRHPLLFPPSSASPTYKPLVDQSTDASALHVAHKPESLSRLMVVLDLDETLVCAYETSSLPPVVRTQAIEAGLKFFDIECLSSEKDADGRPKVNYVTVFERPGLHEFLKQCSDFADLVVFTAGLEGYASPVIDRIDIDKKLTHRLYRPATVSTEHREHVKDLTCLSKDLTRIVIVDNNPFSFLLQPLNGIPCMPFFAAQPCDEQLVGIILPLLKKLSLQEDVRPALYEKFHMPEWFEQQGIPIIKTSL